MDSHGAESRKGVRPGPDFLLLGLRVLLDNCQGCGRRNFEAAARPPPGPASTAWPRSALPLPRGRPGPQPLRPSPHRTDLSFGHGQVSRRWSLRGLLEHGTVFCFPSHMKSLNSQPEKKVISQKTKTLWLTKVVLKKSKVRSEKNMRLPRWAKVWPQNDNFGF